MATKPRHIAAALLLTFSLVGCGSDKEGDAHASPTPGAEAHASESHGEDKHGGDSHQEHDSHGEDKHGSDSHQEHDSHGEDKHGSDSHQEHDSHGEGKHGSDSHQEHDSHGESSEHGESDSHGEKAEGGHGDGHGSQDDEWKTLLKEVNANLDKGEVDEALPHAESALKLAQEKGDPEKLITSLHNLGKIRLSQGRTQESIEFFQRAVKAGEEMEDPDHKLAVLCLNKLAAAHYANEESSLAKKELRRALDIVGEKDPFRIELLQNLAQVYTQEGNQKSADALFEQVRVLKIQEREPPPCFGFALSWVSRVWPESYYRMHAELYQKHTFPMNKYHTSSRYSWRKYPAPVTEEDQEATESSGH